MSENEENGEMVLMLFSDFTVDSVIVLPYLLFLGIILLRGILQSGDFSAAVFTGWYMYHLWYQFGGCGT